MIYIFLAEGFEECEALVTLDILRRGGIHVETVGVGNKLITGAHGITVIADITESDIQTEKIEAVILPGGMPGTLNLEKSEYVQNSLDYAEQNGKLIAAICAAPSILGHKGFLKGVKATCFPGFEKELLGAEVLDLPVVVDKNFITSYGAGAAFDFGFSILTSLTGDSKKTNELASSMKYCDFEG